MNRYFYFIFLSLICFNTIAQQPKLMLPIGHKSFINDISFSPDGEKIITASQDESAIVWNVVDGKMLLHLLGHTGFVEYSSYSADGKYILTASYDHTARLWDAVSGEFIREFKGHTQSIRMANFSPDGKYIATASWDNTCRIWNVADGKMVKILKGHTSYVNSVMFSPDGKHLVTSSFDKTTIIWDVTTGTLYKKLAPHKGAVWYAIYSPSGNHIITSADDDILRIWEANTGKLILESKLPGLNTIEYSPDGHTLVTTQKNNTLNFWSLDSGKLSNQLTYNDTMIHIRNAKYSPNGKYLAVTFYQSDYAQILNAVSGDLLSLLSNGEGIFSINISYNPAGDKIIAACNDYRIREWNLKNGQLNQEIIESPSFITRATYSPDGKYIAFATNDKTATVYDKTKKQILSVLKGHDDNIGSIEFSPDGTKIITGAGDCSVKIWDASTGKLLQTISENKNDCSWSYLRGTFSPDGKRIIVNRRFYVFKVYSGDGKTILKDFSSTLKDYDDPRFSPDGQYFATHSSDGDVKIWNATDGKLVKTISAHKALVTSAYFSPDGKRIISAAYDNTARIFDVATGRLLKELKSHNYWVKTAQFSPDGNFVVTTSWDLTNKLWDSKSGELLYTFFPFGSNDYLIVDKYNHFDGSEGARKLLYFTCGVEAVELNQLKDQLWVPNLAERIMKGDSINAKTLEQLDICGLTPEVEDRTDNETEYRFRIVPKRGGLGESALYVNGIEVKRYNKEQLQNNSGSYEIVIKKQELNTYFIPGGENPVTVKAWIAGNTISSRGLIVKADKTNEAAPPPNLYAIMVGVSDYKGDELDLKYAAKDAADISNALAIASKKLLNTDGKEHVFTYNLITTKDRDLLPEKNSIKKTLEEIGKKAMVNDILLIFFAGHGVMNGSDKKQFYFLTADASKSSAVDAIADVGISTAELTEWMKPANIKAQKRILIFDACNSGQAIRDIVQIGNPDQGYVAARSDEKGQQIKAIEKLNNQSGLIILAASASDQSAYEMGRYSQGLLTYSLLKVMKQQPEILENGKYLDVSNWLNAAKKLVSNLAEGTGARQEPQLNSNNNFNIGLIDDEVRSKIILSSEKPLFARSNFQNADTKIDNLKLRSLIDKEMISISSRGTDAPISYSAEYEGADAYSLAGDYKITGENVTVSVLLIKGGTEVLYRFETKGIASDLTTLITPITVTTTDWLKRNK